MKRPRDPMPTPLDKALAGMACGPMTDPREIRSLLNQLKRNRLDRFVRTASQTIILDDSAAPIIARALELGR